jgi:RND family efflux transporter MFP subunit
MPFTRFSLITAGLITAISLSGCDDAAPPETAERIRAIKPYYVTEPAGATVRRYSGTVAASDTSALSFAVSGTVQTVTIKQGARVTPGQVLATLDPRVDLDRQRQLYAKGWVAKAALDQAVAAHDGAEGELNLARSRLGTAERDLANTRLTAPFGGVIASRNVEPFTETSRGTAVFQINSEGALEVDLSIPDSVVGRLTIGLPVTIEISTIPGCGCSGRITQIGTAAGAANAVDVTASIIDAPGDILPGMAAEVSVPFLSTDGKRGFLVPLVAIAPGDETARGYVFKFDSAKGAVRKTAVTGAKGRENFIEIIAGVTAGDIVAAAGVSFLRDGQKVKLLGQ